VVCLIGAVTLSVAYIFVKRFFAYHLQYRMLPFICLGMALGVFQKQVNHKKNIDHVFIAVLSAFSFFLMSRVLFFAWAGQYGFYILTPALIVYYTFFLKTIPGFIKLNSVRIFFTVCFMALSIFFIINHFSISKYFYQNKTLKIFSLAGNINIFNNTRDYRVKELIEFLAENTNEKDTLAVFPEGILINFLSKRENPLYYYQYLPLDLVRESVEDGIIKDMKNKKIDYVVINQRNTSEYGYIAFGYDYGKKISNYIINNYDFYKQFGSFQSAGQDYGIVVFKRKI
jgi:hypothetical protein